MWASAVAVLSIAVAMALLGPDPFFALIAAVWAAGAILMWRGGRRLAMTGTVVALLPAVLIGTYTVPGMFFLVTHPLSILSVEGVLFSVLGLAFCVVLVSAIGAWIEGRVRALQSRGIPRGLGILVVALFAVMLAEGAVAVLTTPTRSGSRT
jgi:hypothetical protein